MIKLMLDKEVAPPLPAVKEVILELVRFYPRASSLVVQVKGGYYGNLVRFNSDGTISILPGVSAKYGFQLDDEGKIKEQDG